jgi:splicing factor 3A subunit 2
MQLDAKNLMMTVKKVMMNNGEEKDVQVLLETPRGRTAAVMLPQRLLSEMCSPYDGLLCHLLAAARWRDEGILADRCFMEPEAAQHIMLMHNGRLVERYTDLAELFQAELSCFQLKLRLRGGMDRQNRVGSKFGGGGVSSAQQSERERKERLRKLALESIDLAKDPYLMRNHLGSYECKLCLTLHTNEANYLAHTQGKKHQQGLAKRAHMEKLKQEKELQAGMPMTSATNVQAPKAKKIRIGRPAYQVFKSRDSDTNQRCLSFELQYPEIEADLQPRHRFMSAFEQRIESPPDRRFQYLLFAAEPYETVAFKIPNEPIDKGEDKFVTHWDAEDKKFTLSLFFVEAEQQEEGEGQ